MQEIVTAFSLRWLMPLQAALSVLHLVSTVRIDNNQLVSFMMRVHPVEEGHRPRLLLDPPRPGGPGSSPASAASPSTLYPPSFAEIRAVTGDVAADELTGCDGWDPELHNATEEESELVEEYFEASWDENAEHAPENWPKLMPKQMLSSRDKEAPRRVPVLYNQGGSRFTAQELFAPASTLAATLGFMAIALNRDQELCTFDLNNASLPVDQPMPMTIEELLQKRGYANYFKEPTLFIKDGAASKAGLILHADDGLLASTRSEREELQRLLGEKVKVEFSTPMVHAGDELHVLKRKYIKMEDGTQMGGTLKLC
ncbi:hypothetical protein AK812_SmicGene19368 [Symbiodinium microadriaticum]|uniref:Reverse transcriptase Ty1/copia-type domain-containing protein n=1 Tax=Symbiodinium microadriaticum TaxID=2951 RepID=A0A1Q9DSV1_SYMMI|nr:hypothetical protein AK812_SmicGene19368 [Symbiodinium microadriaticum]